MFMYAVQSFDHSQLDPVLQLKSLLSFGRAQKWSYTNGWEYRGETG